MENTSTSRLKTWNCVQKFVHTSTTH